MSAETSHDNGPDPFEQIRKDIKSYQVQKQSESIPTFGTKHIEHNNRSTVHEMKQAAYFLIGCDSNVQGNDPKLNSATNFSKGVIDTILELPEFLEQIASNPSLLKKIISKIHEMNLSQQLNEMFTKYDTPYDAGKSSTNSILTVLGIGGIIKGGISIVGRVGDRLAKSAAGDMLTAPGRMIGDTMVISAEQSDALTAMTRASNVRDIASNPSLKTTLSLGLDKLNDLMLKIAKEMPILGPTLIQSEKIIKKMREYIGKFPNTKDAAIVGLSLMSIEKNMSTILDRSAAQYSVEEDSQERKKIQENAVTLIQDMLKTQFVAISKAVIQSIFK